MPADRPWLPRLLFWGPTLIWASTWHVILYQLDAPVPVPLAVGWRFGLAALLLAALARWRGERLAMPLALQPWLLANGVLQFGASYWGVYEAERHIPSGLVAVLYALMVFGNAFTGAWLFGRPVTRRFIGAAGVGVLGVALVFWPELLATSARPSAGLGLAIGLGSVALAVCGNAMTLTLSRRGLPLVPLLAWGMGYGALVLLAVGTVQMLGRGAPAFGSTLSWWASLLYLAGAGSVAAFLMYFRLAQIEGPARAALTGVITPVIALAVSAAFEGWQPTPLSLAGMALCVGSVFVATRPAPAAAEAAA